MRTGKTVAFATTAIMGAAIIGAQGAMAEGWTGTEKQITDAASGHILTNVNVFSPDGKWIVFDARSDEGGAHRSGTIVDTAAMGTGINLDARDVTPQRRVTFTAERSNPGVQGPSAPLISSRPLPSAQMAA